MNYFYVYYTCDMTKCNVTHAQLLSGQFLETGL